MRYHIRIPLCRRHRHRRWVQITQLSCVSLKFTTSILLLLPTTRLPSSVDNEKFSSTATASREVLTIITNHYHHYIIRNNIYVACHTSLLLRAAWYSQSHSSPVCWDMYNNYYYRRRLHSALLYPSFQKNVKILRAIASRRWFVEFIYYYVIIIKMTFKMNDFLVVINYT